MNTLEFEKFCDELAVGLGVAKPYALVELAEAFMEAIRVLAASQDARSREIDHPTGTQVPPETEC